MTQSYVSTMVFAGTFPPDMFDEREFFDGKLDPGQRRITGPAIRCGYASGKYQLVATPERIDLVAIQTPQILPDALVDAARVVAARIEGVRRAVQVSGVGMSCDTIFNRHSIGGRGEDYCLKLVKPTILTLVDAESAGTMTKTMLRKDTLLYEVRFEPYFNSLGEDLYVAINCHQDVDKAESLDDKVQQKDAFQTYVEGLHKRIIDTEWSK